jgi:hypothetical protein
MGKRGKTSSTATAVRAVPPLSWGVGSILKFYWCPAPGEAPLTTWQGANIIDLDGGKGAREDFDGTRGFFRAPYF